MVIDVRADDYVEPRDAEAFAAMEDGCAHAGWRLVVSTRVVCDRSRHTVKRSGLATKDR
jgi:hypothetical protein